LSSWRERGFVFVGRCSRVVGHRTQTPLGCRVSCSEYTTLYRSGRYCLSLLSIGRNKTRPFPVYITVYITVYTTMIIICPRAASRRRRDCSGPDPASSSGSHPASPSGRPAATGSASRPSLSRSSAPSLHYRNTPRHGSCSRVAGSSASAPRTGSACSPETPLLLLLLLRGYCSCRCPDSSLNCNLQPKRRDRRQTTDDRRISLHQTQH